VAQLQQLVNAAAGLHSGEARQKQAGKLYRCAHLEVSILCSDFHLVHNVAQVQQLVNAAAGLQSGHQDSRRSMCRRV
jgi:hypothetical protein